MSYKQIIDQVEIPSYTRKQEVFNGISHFLGLPVALVISIAILIAYLNRNIPLNYFVGVFIFVLSISAVYLVSTTYHLIDANACFYKRLFRIIDHCTIYLLIAGTYTPICIVLMGENIIGLVMLLIEWVAALIGIILNAFFFNNKIAQIISLILYLVMGWLVLFCGGFIYMTTFSFAFVLAGGIIYSIGAILYAVGKKNLNLHGVFHIFVLVSTIVQAIGVLSLFY